MELEEQSVEDSRNNSELVDSKQSVNIDDTSDKVESDKETNTDTMKRDIVLRSADSPMDVSDEQSKPTSKQTTDSVCGNISDQADSSREESSDYSESEESSRCQLTNQALRAKLLNSVINPISDRESKLRVSVFDHRIIPKTLISPKTGDNRNHVDTSDNQNLNTLKQTQSQDNINERDCTNNKRSKVSTLPYNSMLTAGCRRTSGGQQDGAVRGSTANCSENGKMESDYEIRTRFDILLRNLIGDVDSINVQPSPMTVSSGYESDYIQTQTAQNGGEVNDQNECNTNVNGDKDSLVVTKSEDTPTDYFTMSETYPQTQDIAPTDTTTQLHPFTSLPAFPTQYSDNNNTGPVNSAEPKTIPNTSKPNDRDFGFFYAQRQNYKLTKVTRSMYEIIHDLQKGEIAQPDGKKRSRKGRRPGQDSGSDGNNSSSKDTLTRGRPGSGDGKSDNHTGNASLKRTKETNNSCVSGSVVRCVRRPACAPDPALRPVQRRFSQSENEGRLGPAGAVNSDKVQNDLRNLLCDTADVTASSASINDQCESFNLLSSSKNTKDGFASGVTSTADNAGNHPDVSISGEENRIIEGKRKPSLNERFNNRPKPDDHVYETIPGDEKFYEEWKKMRTTMPQIRRFTTIPDLPGTFIPKEPPALPARKYLNNANQVGVSKKRELSDSNDNYIIMGDVNSNFPTPEKSDSGYTAVSPDPMLILREPQCFPYPRGNTSPSDNFGRHDETSDGYCSIDNLSLIREPVDTSAVTPFSSHEKPRDWRIPEPTSVPPPPRLKRSDFFINPNQKHFIQNGFSLFNHEHPAETVTSPEVLERRWQRDLPDENSFMSPSFEQRTVKQPFQATYV